MINQKITKNLENKKLYIIKAFAKQSRLPQHRVPLPILALGPGFHSQNKK